MEANTKPIVYVLGVEGHFYLAEAFKKEFGRPVVGILSSERASEMLTAERSMIFDRVYSLPDLYLEHRVSIEAMSLDELNARHLALEKKLGIETTTMLTNHDRRIRRIGDYRKVRHWQLCNLMLIDQVLQDIQPAFVMDGVVVYLQLALRKACEKKDIPYLLSFASRNNSYALYHIDGQQVGMQSLLKKFLNNNFQDVPEAIIQEADSALDAFLEKPQKPAYAIQNATIGFNWPVIKHKLKLAFNKKKLFPSKRVRDVDIYMNAELKFTDIVKNFILNKARRALLKIINAMDEAPDLSVPYVYVPLHYTPENSDLHFGPEYDHHEAFIVHLAKYMPSDCQLYVKEHTSMPGRRPLYFYKNLEKLYNVKVLSPKVDTFALIKNAKATVTVTGTPGWEAFLLGRPAVVFGNVFFNNLPGILKTEMKDGFHKVFVDYIENFKPDPDVIRNAFRAYYASTFKAAKVDVGYTSSKNQALEHAEAFVRDVKRVIYNRHDEMKGHFPLDLIEEDLSMEKNMQNRASV